MLNSAELRYSFRIVARICFLLSVFCITGAAIAQLSTASISGIARDSSGAVVANATVTLRNVDTSVERASVSNGSGEYVFLNITPGRYTLEAKATGFSPQQIPEFVLTVGQTATMNFTLTVGTQTQVVTVEAGAQQLDLQGADLGAVIATKQVNEIPLNGRNFTQLLQLTPGVSPIMTGQAAGMQNSGGFGAPVTIGADYSFPAVNGQTNRSNMYLMDGLNDYGTIESTYAVPPIIDSVQEFKVVSHTDNAEFGSVLGGVVNVVTKSGTNDFHGGAWDYVRNTVFDARNYFLPPDQPKPAYHENQFGASVGGPVLIPKLYNGRNKTFFFGAYQGFRYSKVQDTNLLVPTAAQLAGDESGAPQIYNPFTTRPDPANPGSYIRDPFPGNQIPSSLIDPRMVAYAQYVFPAAGPFFSNGTANALDTTPLIQNQDEFSVRVDQNFGSKDSAWFRYSFINSQVTTSGNLPALHVIHPLDARDWGGSYVHIFNPGLILQAQFAHITVLDNTATRFITSTSGIYSTVGFNDDFASGFAGANGGSLIPGPGISGYANGGESINDTPKATDSYEYHATVSKIVGNHQLKFGGGYTTNNFVSPLSQIGLTFDATSTAANPNVGGTGDAVSSFILNVPHGASRRNVDETTRPGGLLSVFGEDSWKVTPKFTLNFGLRYDYTFIPPYGTNATIGQQGGIETGDMDFGNGTYVVQKLPPPCSVRGHAPCIPGDGTLPDHVVVDPRGKIAHNVGTNFGPRLGFAYSVDDKTVIRGAFGIVYDNWAAVTQMAQNIEGAWPDIGQQIQTHLNEPTSASPTPTVQAQNPLVASGSGLFPPATPFTNNTWFYDPHIKNPYSEQWNFGVQRQLNSSTAVTINYVGSGSHRTNVGGYYNTALTPGPGDYQARAPYPYSIPTFYDRSAGFADYNALQVEFDRRYTNGFSYGVSYTYSKAMTEDDGWFGVEGSLPQNPYNPSGSRSVSGFDLTHVLSINALYEVPIGKGKRFSTGNGVLDYILGNWQINGLLTGRSGQPFSPTISSDIANIGNDFVYLNRVGDPHRSNRNAAEWFNTGAYQSPAPFTFGNAGRNSLRSQPYWDLTPSVIRSFPIWESLQFQFRAEAFNVLNHTVFSTPGSDLNNPQLFGVVTSTANYARELQLSGKIVF
ncbi:carboxypeptidase regulatory-like domain-containing protein [Alloacidobacterium dinghuense]|uniref:Carboxypeptidase regulatory-like domain-containing protein n=1 Tax=Alloacidobacterium dinghuense TaxID=2763107 RepID=A0A7G8BH61_9BACT|nr:carboxypeptidase regulatory-like domain-containing protein [Alloacidobacterium dinghuense]QNI31881.1 carboxypeptidase regulatory-like domain-containing protein [Alloacidobacterium dinghuense]